MEDKYPHRIRNGKSSIILTPSRIARKYDIDKFHISDLTQKVRRELFDYYKDAGEQAFTIVLKQAVGKIFENLDFEYTHMCVMKNLTVKLIE